MKHVIVLIAMLVTSLVCSANEVAGSKAGAATLLPEFSGTLAALENGTTVQRTDDALVIEEKTLSRRSKETIRIAKIPLVAGKRFSFSVSGSSGSEKLTIEALDRSSFGESFRSVNGKRDPVSELKRWDVSVPGPRGVEFVRIAEAFWKELGFDVPYGVVNAVVEARPPARPDKPAREAEALDFLKLEVKWGQTLPTTLYLNSRHRTRIIGYRLNRNGVSEEGEIRPRTTKEIGPVTTPFKDNGIVAAWFK